MAGSESGQGGGRGRRRRSRRDDRGAVSSAPPLNPVRDAFLACGRCGHFLAGYRAALGSEHVDALLAASGRWLQLEWTPRVQALLEAALGVRVGGADYYLSLCCPECRRAYVIQTEPGAGLTLQVGFLPRARR